MAKLLAMDKTPVDGAACDRRDFERCVPVANKIPGLRRFEASKVPLATPAGAAPGCPIAPLTSDSMATIRSALASLEGQSAAADLADFATGSVDHVFSGPDRIRA